MSLRLSRLYALCLLTAVFLGCGGGGGGGETIGAPSGLQAHWSETAAGAVSLAWTPSPGEVTAYRIESRLGTGDFALVSPGGTLPSSTTSTTLNLDPAVLPELTGLDFRVCALKNGSKSSFSNVASLTTRLRSPGTPTVDGWVGGLRVTWTNPSTAADAVTLERGAVATYTMAGATWARVATLAAGTLQYIDLDVPENAYVSYRLTNAKGQASTASADSYPVHTYLQGPLGLTATGGTERTHLEWTNRSASATALVVTRYDGFSANAIFMDVAVLPPTATSFDDLNVPTGYYSYRVDARMAGDSWGAPSNVAQVATLPVTGSSLVLQPSIESWPATYVGGLTRDGSWVLPVAYGPTTSGFLTGSGSTWAWQPLQDMFQMYVPGLMWDASGNPHLVVGRTLVAGSPVKAIVHAWREGGGWHFEEMVQTELGYGFGALQCAALDASGNPVFLWQSAADSTAGVRLAMKVGGGWQVESVNPGWAQAPQHLGLALDGSGAPVMLAGKGSNLTLHRRIGPGAWTEEAVPQDLNGGFFGGMDLLATSDGDLHILACRYDPEAAGAGQILWTRRTSGGWSPVDIIHTHANYHADYALCHLSPAGDQVAVGYTSAVGTWVLSYRQGAWSKVLLGRGEDMPPFIGFTPEGRLRVLQNTTPYHDGSLGLYIVFREP